MNLLDNKVNKTKDFSKDNLYTKLMMTSFI